MAETQKQTVPFTFNEQAFKDKVAKLQSQVEGLRGKEGYNPTLWMNQKVTPLVKQFDAGIRSKELSDAMAALPTTIPALHPSHVKQEEPVKK